MELSLGILVVAGVAVGSIYLIKYLKERKIRERIGEVERFILSQKDKMIANNNKYSLEIVLKIQSLLVEHNTDKYEILVISNRNKRRVLINDENRISDISRYMDLMVEYNKDYIKLIEDQSVFKFSKIISESLYREALQVCQNDQNKNIQLQQSKQKDIRKLKQSIPTQFENLTANKASDAIKYMMNIIKNLDNGLNDVLQVIIQRKDVEGLLYGVISSTLFDFLNQSKEFRGIEEEDIFRFIISPNQDESTLIYDKLQLFSKAVIQLIQYVQQSKS